MLSEETRAKILQLKTRYPSKRSASIPSLYLLQAEQDYCTREGMEEVAELLEMTPADVYSVASFYTMFYKEPSGKKVVDVCTNLACMVNGSDELLTYISERLGTPVNEVSPDGRCLLRHVECLGYCELAPVMEIDYRPFGPMTRELADRVLAEENLLPDSGPAANGVSESSLDLSGTKIYGTGRGQAPAAGASRSAAPAEQE